ncbi:hypothetical protein [uncultured Aliiroseovarius sp.]|uniref:hypothetical protein n=1 Tax=uncultured Aliiroseovarius sp. TaxID=1658783 RepID=UPI002630172B|nr:hypothetical protein [uncultured Aliiroseovarius sp.]
MLLFAGDPWLEKISRLIAEFNPNASVTFIKAQGDDTPSAEVVDAATVLITSRSAAQTIAGRRPDLQCPNLSIDGLYSLEMKGKTVLGAEYLPETLPMGKVNRLMTTLARGEIDFQCPERFAASMDELKQQEVATVSISDFIEERYRDRQLFSGSDRPDPIVTVEMSRRIAAELSLKEADINRSQPWRTDWCAYRKSTNVMLPTDAERMGMTFEPDHQWFGNMMKITPKLYTEDGHLKKDE